MLRNGFGGARRAGEGIAVGAERGAAEEASAGLFTTDPAPDGGPVGPDRSPNVGSATVDLSASLSLCRLSGEALAGLGRDALLGVLGDIERVANRLAGYRAEVLGALDALSRSGAAPDAAPHLSLRDAAGVSERDARRMVRGAEKAREHGVVLEALSEGGINASQAEALCDARVPDGVRAELVAAAAGEDTDATRRRVRQAEADHSVETPMERFERQRQARSAGWQRDHEGMLRLWAKLDPEVGAAVEANLEALRRQYWLDDKQVRSGRRTPAQRDADVLAYALAGITLTDTDSAAVDRLRARSRPDRLPTHEPAAGNPERRLPPAQIGVLIGLDALRGQTDVAGLTDAGVELPPEIVRRLACDAEIIPMILGGPGGPADAGRSTRTVSLRLRRLLIARDRHGQWPGCAEPPSRCDAHHVHHWIHGGRTDLDNLVLLCHRHHHHLHQHGHTMVPQPDGTWTTTHTTEPEPANAARARAAQPRAP
ncbi:DUF222 domain-containing protein [Candidatus Poriferisodalis sp.]|uniref:HNH endonuclease signature motif containing protein n=1 Tax=Candidatus Poriferisodalis sp. TaxID=3101277 RepID=UPI003B023CA4